MLKVQLLHEAKSQSVSIARGGRTYHLIIGSDLEQCVHPRRVCMQ